MLAAAVVLSMGQYGAVMGDRLAEHKLCMFVHAAAVVVSTGQSWAVSPP